MDTYACTYIGQMMHYAKGSDESNLGFAARKPVSHMLSDLSKWATWREMHAQPCNSRSWAATPPLGAPCLNITYSRDGAPAKSPTQTRGEFGHVAALAHLTAAHDPPIVFAQGGETSGAKAAAYAVWSEVVDG